MNVTLGPGDSGWKAALFHSGGNLGTSRFSDSELVSKHPWSLPGMGRQKEGTGVSQPSFKKQKNVGPKFFGRDRAKLESQSPGSYLCASHFTSLSLSSPWSLNGHMIVLYRAVIKTEGDDLCRLYSICLVSRSPPVHVSVIFWVSQSIHQWALTTCCLPGCLPEHGRHIEVQDLSNIY